MRNIYVLTSGEYSDRSIVGCYGSEDMALKAADEYVKRPYSYEYVYDIKRVPFNSLPDVDYDGWILTSDNVVRDNDLSELGDPTARIEWQRIESKE